MIIQGFFQTLLLFHFILYSGCILFSRVMLNHLTLHKKSCLGLDKSLVYITGLLILHSPNCLYEVWDIFSGIVTVSRLSVRDIEVPWP